MVLLKSEKYYYPINMQDGRDQRGTRQECLSSHKKRKDMMDSSCNGEQMRRCYFCIK